MKLRLAQTRRRPNGILSARRDGPSVELRVDVVEAGFPASVGMDLRPSTTRPSQGCIPRPGGDGPRIVSFVGDAASYSPRARGSTCSRHRCGRPIHVCPARAGMNRFSSSAVCPARVDAGGLSPLPRTVALGVCRPRSAICRLFLQLTVASVRAFLRPGCARCCWNAVRLAILPSCSVITGCSRFFWSSP